VTETIGVLLIFQAIKDRRFVISALNVTAFAMKAVVRPALLGTIVSQSAPRAMFSCCHAFLRASSSNRSFVSGLKSNTTMPSSMASGNRLANFQDQISSPCSGLPGA
jgi:hypothetical protein